MTIALDDIRGLGCTLCEQCWLIDVGRTLDDAIAARSLRMPYARGATAPSTPPPISDPPALAAVRPPSMLRLPTITTRPLRPFPQNARRDAPRSPHAPRSPSPRCRRMNADRSPIHLEENRQ